MREYHILFTGVGRRVELVQAFRQAALCLDKKIKIYGTDLADTAPALIFCDFSRFTCGMKNKDYIGELLEICKADAIDLVIPTIDTDLLTLSENRERFEAVGTKVLISNPEMIRICRDKNITSQFFADCGLKAPMPVNSWKKYKGGFPAFIKPKDGSSSINAYKAENMEELKRYASQIEDYIVQPFIDGTEYTVDVFCDFAGNPVYITPRIRLMVRAGEVLKTKIDLDKQIIEECGKIITQFKPCGPMAIQLIRDKEGRDYYIEINPRYGGGAPLSMKAGARSAEVLLKLLDGETVHFDNGRISNGAIYSRFDQSVCVKEGRNLRVEGVIFDLDDTLYSEKEYVKSGYGAIAGYLGDNMFADKLLEYFEQGKNAIDELLREVGKEQEKENCLKIYRSHKPNIVLYSGVAELIEELKERGIKVGIITDGRPEGQRNKLEALGLYHLINDIIITDELGGTQFRKPNETAFCLIQKQWKIPFETMIYVGDNTDKDFQAPRELGMGNVWFKNTEGLYFTNHAKVPAVQMEIENINEILSIITETAIKRP